MNIILSHLAFLFFSILILYLVRKENFSGAAHGLISFISVIFVFFITFSFHEVSNNKIVLFEFIENAPISFYIDSLGLVFLIISNLLWFCVAIYATRYLDINKYDKKGDFYIFFLISMFATNAIVYSSNLITTFIFYELLTVATYPLVTFKKDEESVNSGKKYLYYLLGTSIVFLLPAIVITYIQNGSVEYTQGGIFSSSNQIITFIALILFTLGVAKSALMPFHKWLPTAMVAPTPVSALLHAVAVVKSGVYIIIKIILFIFGIEVIKDNGAVFIILLASFTTIIASIIALKQDSIKLRLAYSTIGQLAYIVLATAILAPFSILAAVLHLAFHALGKIILFLSAGIIATRVNVKYVSEMNGISTSLPYTSLLLSLGAIIMVGLPPTIGFISKWFLIQGIIDADMYILVSVIILSTILNAAYYFPMIYKPFFGPSNKTFTYKEDMFLVLPVALIGLISVVLFFTAETFIIFIEQQILL